MILDKEKKEVASIYKHERFYLVRFLVFIVDSTVGGRSDSNDVILESSFQELLG